MPPGYSTQTPTPPPTDSAFNPRLTQPPPYQTPLQVIKTPWLKLALVGIALPLIITFSLYGLFKLAGKLDESAAVWLIGSGFLGLVLVLVVILLMLITIKILKKWSLEAPIAISLGTGCFVYLTIRFIDHLENYSFTNLLTSGSTGHIQSIAASVPEPIILSASGCLGILAITFVLERLYKLSYMQRFAIASVFVLLPLIATYLVHPRVFDVATGKEEEVNSGDTSVLISHVKDIKWVILPAQLPKGVASHEDCKEAPASYEVDCDYYFENYPGYLSTAGQKILENSKTNFGGNEATIIRPNNPLIGIEEAQYDADFTPYEYRNGKCDIRGINTTIFTAKVYRAKPSPKLVDCQVAVTPHGQRVYYIQNQYSIASPWAYYFKKDGAIVYMSPGFTTEGINKGDVLATYYTDKNFVPAILTFVDSFTKP